MWPEGLAVAPVAGDGPEGLGAPAVQVEMSLQQLL